MSLPGYFCVCVFRYKYILQYVCVYLGVSVCVCMWTGMYVLLYILMPAFTYILLAAGEGHATLVLMCY